MFFAFNLNIIGLTGMQLPDGITQNALKNQKFTAILIVSLSQKIASTFASYQPGYRVLRKQ
jgi:hypothetical protein